MPDFNVVLEEIMQLDFASRALLPEIVQKRQIKERRAEIANHARRSKADYEQGKLSVQSATDAIGFLKTL